MITHRKRVTKRLASGLLAGALALGGLAISGGSVSAKTPSSPTTNRLAGDDRYETAVEVARDAFGVNPSAGVILVSGESPYDALAAAALAKDDMPVLLVKSASLPESVSDYLSDARTNIQGVTNFKFYVVGGTSAVSDDVVSSALAIVNAGDATPATSVRIAGDNRYSTAAALSQTIGVQSASARLILANGAGWADALSAAALSAENGWPIVLTGNGGLNDEAKAAITAYLGLPGSSAKFLIVGGPAVMPTSVEEYLVGEGVAPADIDRRGGVDRYQTSLLLNLYMLNIAALGGEGNAAAFVGTDVALVSGLSPWDALASSSWAALNNTHTLLVGSTLGASGTVLAGALAAANLPSNLKVIGGKSAVAESVKTTFIATTQSTNVVSSVSGCVDGSDTLTVTFVKRLTTAEGTDLTTFGAALQALFSLNGVKESTTSFISSIAAKTQVLTGAARSQYTITLSSALVGDDVVSFVGIPEGISAAWGRSVGGFSCTVAEDTTAPSASIKVVTDGSNLDHILLTASEAIDGSAVTASAITAGYTPGGAVSASQMDSDGKVWKIVDASPATLSATTVVTISKAAIVDLASTPNAALVDVSGTAATDSTPATSTFVLAQCEATAAASASKSDLDVTAVATGTAGGVAGNGYKLVVTNQRGLLLPAVSVNSDAKTINVVADTGYHTAADVVTASKNAGLAGTWTFANGAGSGSGAITSTTGVQLTGGTDSCYAILANSEPTALSSLALTVNGVVTAVTNGGAGAGNAVPLSGGAQSTTHMITFTASAKGSVVLSMDTQDIAASTTTATTASTSI
ncbi:MAG: cell wall-binding repeat-containing protein [Actinomycetota bacterium]|nr:cell wall-binding repeat-containing protein [Actinomycetota bacterium]